MPIKLLMPLNLQLFAEDDGTGAGGNNLTGDEELAAAIRGLLNPSDDNDNNDDYNEDDDIDNDDDDDNDDEDDSDDDIDDEDDDDSDDDEDNDEDDTDDNDPPVSKKKQSKADNAKFAKERREREARERAEAELERLKQESPEFQLAKMLSETYGQPVEQIMRQIQEEQLRQEAAQRKVPIEELREKRAEKERADRLEQSLMELQFKDWQRQMSVDGTKLLNEYKMLTQEDMDAAENYILNVAKNVEMPLEDAVFAVHGKKIAKALAKGQQQEDLAKQSGRSKKTPLPPNNSKAKKNVSLTADEQAMARAFNMSDEEYAKYKS
jgi:hypothetical protein